MVDGDRTEYRRICFYSLLCYIRTFKCVLILNYGHHLPYDGNSGYFIYSTGPGWTQL